MRHGGSRGPGLLSSRRSMPAAALARTTGRRAAGTSASTFGSSAGSRITTR